MLNSRLNYYKVTRIFFRQMNRTPLVAGFSAILLSVLIFIYFANSGKKKATTDTDQQNSIGKPNENTDQQSGQDPKNDPEKRINNAPPKNISDSPLIPKGLSHLTPGMPVTFQVSMDAHDAENDIRKWEGNFTIRYESKTSSATVQRKRLDQGSRPAKTVSLVSKQFGTGLRIPNRWVLVSNNFVEGADKITVLFDGKSYPAKVRTRLAKSQIATLQIEGVRFPKVPIPVEDSIRQGANFAWLNSDGTLATAQKVKHSNYSGYQGGQYAFKQVLPDNCVGGITYDQRGNVTGLIVDASHPTTRSGAYCRVHPMKRVARAWNEANQKILFETERQQLPSDLESALSKCLVQVLVERPALPDSPDIFFVDADLKAPQAASGRKVGFHKPRIGLKVANLYTFDDKTLNTKSKFGPTPQLPFYLGTLLEQVLFACVTQNGTRPIKISEIGYEFCGSDEANGLFETAEYSIEMVENELVGHRLFEINSESESIRLTLNGDHQFVLSPADRLPLTSEITGHVKIGSEDGARDFDFRLLITRRTE